MFTVGQFVQCVDDKQSDLWHELIYTVLDVASDGDDSLILINNCGKQSWFRANRFVPIKENVPCIEPITNKKSFEDRFVAELKSYIQDKIKESGLETEAAIENDDYICSIQDFAYELDYKVEISMEPKITVTKR